MASGASAPLLALLVVATLLSRNTEAATLAEWRGRTIYQVSAVRAAAVAHRQTLPLSASCAHPKHCPLPTTATPTHIQVVTDRFSPTDVCWGKPCRNLQQYCGGTFSGLINRQNTILDLGFDAVWISPHVAQGPDTLGVAGYHGYWPSDHYAVNPAFGSREDLQALMAAYHQKGRWVWAGWPQNSSRAMDESAHFLGCWWCWCAAAHFMSMHTVCSWQPQRLAEDSVRHPERLSAH